LVANRLEHHATDATEAVDTDIDNSHF
jgi:hypothetical protein